MRMIQNALDTATGTDKKSIQAAAEKQITEYTNQKKRLPGFGHRLHTRDPRTIRLLEMAAKVQVAGAAITMLQALAAALEQQTGRALPINVDGAIAAVLLDLGIPAELGNTFFMMARLPGLVAHIHEETTRERPMRHIHPTQHDYDGALPEE